MAVKRKQNFLGGQRVDVPHLRSIESGVAADFADVMNRLVSSGSINHLIRGFAHNAESISVPRGSWSVSLANSVVLSKTDEICLFQFPSDAETIYPFQTGTYSDGVDYFIGVTISSVTHDPQIVKFIDDLTNEEVSKTVPLAVILDYTVLPAATSTNADPNTIWLYQVQSVAGMVSASNVSYPTGTDYPFIANGIKYTNLIDWITGVATGTAGGPAGGILGYNELSSYPDPNGLAAVDGVFAPTSTAIKVIPIKTESSPVFLKMDDGVSGSPNGGSLYVVAGAGEDGGDGGGGGLAISGGWSTGTGYGGNVTVEGGRSAASGGDVTVTGGDTTSNGNAGNAHLSGGSAFDTGNGGEVTIEGGSSTNGTIGGSIFVTAGNSTGSGGNVTVDAGTGTSSNGTVNLGTTNSVEVNVGNSGSDVTVDGASVTATAHAGGNVEISTAPNGSGDGGDILVTAGTGTTAGGDVEITAGATSDANSIGGNARVYAGAGGAADGSFSGGQGGTASMAGGAGGVASSSFSAGNGGLAGIVGGSGGSGSASQSAGTGGTTAVQGGTGGSNSFGGGVGDGGEAHIYGGTAGGAGGTSGRVYIQDRSSIGKPAQAGTSGGGIVLRTVTGGDASATLVGGTGGGLTVSLGGGGDASSAQNAGAAGAILVTAGQGGKANGVHAATAGGAITIEGGVGGNGNGTTAAAAGGAITIVAGAAGALDTGAGAAGGNVTVQAGAGTGTVAGGTAWLMAGNGSSTGTGGRAIVHGGSGLNGGDTVIYGGTGTSIGADTFVDAGQGSSTANSGTLKLGTRVQSGISFEKAVDIGSSGINVSTSGRDVLTPQSVTTAATHTVNTPLMLINIAGAGPHTVTLNDGTTDGTKVTIVNIANNTTTIAGTIQYETNHDDLDQYHSITLIWASSTWIEIAHAKP